MVKTIDQNTSDDHETRVMFSTIAKNARNQLEQLRTTPELITALDEREHKIDELAVKHQQLSNVNEEVNGEGIVRGFSVGNLAANFRRVAFDASGNVRIYPIDHPEVTGVYMHDVPKPPTEDL